MPAARCSSIRLREENLLKQIVIQIDGRNRYDDLKQGASLLQGNRPLQRAYFNCRMLEHLAFAWRV
jgi:hypothetical protein